MIEDNIDIIQQYMKCQEESNRIHNEKEANEYNHVCK